MAAGSLPRKRFYATAFPLRIGHKDQPPEWPVSGVYILRKSKNNRSVPVSLSKALHSALLEVICFRGDLVPENSITLYNKRVFGFLSEMLEEVEFSIVEFNKKSDVFSCIGL